MFEKNAKLNESELKTAKGGRAVGEPRAEVVDGQ